jgi:uncharacterized protein (TIGR02444 family)
MSNKPQTFWNFSTQLYDKEGVAEACLGLQDDFNLDVNLVLFCYWHGSHFGIVEPLLLQQIYNFSVEWRSNVVQPLRDLRIWMKEHKEADKEWQSLRNKIKANELAAEKYQQEVIENLVTSTSKTKKAGRAKTDIHSNLEKMLQKSALTLNKDIESRLAVLSKNLAEKA